MRFKSKWLSGARPVLAALLLFGILGVPLHSAACANDNNNLVVFDGVSTNLPCTLDVGHNGTNNRVVIRNGASVTDPECYIGFAAVADANSVLVTGTNSTWRNKGALYVGRNGSDNVLAITDSARVFAQEAYVGYTPPSSGNRIEVSGGSSLTVTNTARTAACEIRRGSLVLDDGTVRANRLLVSQGATLSGSGTIIGATTNAGLLSPGHSIGTLTFTGSATLTSTSLLDLDMAGCEPGTQFDTLQVSGSLTLGGTLRVWLRDGFVPEPWSRYTIATAGCVTGDFVNLILANAPTGEAARVFVEGNLVILEFDCPEGSGGGASDSDRDGLPDGWEGEYFGGATNGAPDEDSDGDGQSNYEEYVADTSPTSSNSLLRISVKPLEDQEAVEFTSSSNRFYTLMYATNLIPTATWSNLQVNVKGWGGLMQLIHENPADHGFYRVAVRGR